jgi:uncharacterized membrane protein HdeD (DUF308 family)
MSTQYEFILVFMRHIAKMLIIDGVIAVVLGALILIYPELLAVLVGLFLIVVGAISFYFAKKVWAYSRIKFEI